VAGDQKTLAMSLTPISAQALVLSLKDFDAIIDARSEHEFALDHLPGAINWPTLNNQQRIEVGTTYKLVNAFEARKIGAAMAARNIAAHIESQVVDKPKDWRPLAYCWRGGKRSGSLALVLDQIGFRVTLLEGGYKSFRAAMLPEIDRLSLALSWRVVSGTTGSGKTRLLQALQMQGAQVLDLEALANHRSSVLGAVPGLAQPAQKNFDTLIWQALSQFDTSRPVFVESESKKVGNVSIPTCLMEVMRASPCIILQMAQEDRVALLMQDYDYFTKQPEAFCDRLDSLAQIRGKSVVESWKASVRQGNFAPVVAELLTEHYDPVYLASMQRNFKLYADASQVKAKNGSREAMLELASELLTSF
jgi:tRNA 2-selenouridine synthase